MHKIFTAILKPVTFHFASEAELKLLDETLLVYHLKAENSILQFVNTGFGSLVKIGGWKPKWNSMTGKKLGKHRLMFCSKNREVANPQVFNSDLPMNYLLNNLTHFMAKQTKKLFWGALLRRPSSPSTEEMVLHVLVSSLLPQHPFLPQTLHAFIKNEVPRQ